jgi:serine/threonine protein kinase
MRWILPGGAVLDGGSRQGAEQPVACRPLGAVLEQRSRPKEDVVLQPGARPLPDYELVRKLGEGGFGEVWQARAPGGLDIAMKFIQMVGRTSDVELRSLEMMKSIRHPNLVGLFGAWRRANLLILAMELCDRTLHDRLREAREQNLPGIPLKELLNYMRDAARGLDALHAKAVQHRDVKPMNLLLMQDGVKVADFGLAKVLDQTAASHSGALTLAFAAPEFFKGETHQHSDQYSLAATYYYLRFGHLLFGGDSHQMIYGHLHEQPDLSQLPKGEGAIVARALAKRSADRWPSCEAFVNRLIETVPLGKHQQDQLTASDSPKPTTRKEVRPGKKKSNGNIQDK